MSEAMQVTVIGDGAMGTLCALLLATNGHRVRLWGIEPERLERIARQRENRQFLPGAKLPETVTPCASDAEAFTGAELIVSAVPCQFTRSAWRRLRQVTPSETPICSVTKGIENGTLLRPTQIVAEVLGSRPMASLSGPSIAPEVAKRQPATVVVAGEDTRLAEHVQTAFSTNWFRVYRNTDLVGVELAGATKNVIALAAGILDGLGMGCNAKAALLTRGLVEITRLGVAMGARAETFSGLAGMGDLVTTCISPIGRNRSAGEALGRGKTVDEVVSGTAAVIEGIATTRSVVALAERHGVEMPITAAAHAVLFEGRKPTDAIAELMARTLKPETE